MSVGNIQNPSGPSLDPQITRLDQPDTMPRNETLRETSAVSSGRASPTLRNERLHKRRPWWLPRFGAGIINDVRSRLPWYKSDWTDAWNYRVVPATALIFFAK
jgi:hypothetical protein